MNTRTNTPDAGPEPGDADVRRRLSAIDSDPALADAIHQDGTALIRLGLPVHLDRYLAAVRDLARRPEPLDAALSVALTSLVRQG
ncbi:MAG: hypothetical protein JNJ48_04745, partial [Phycisphaerae bacterium]|nr:hypothetical protein [Phycisphaerae bacterium]